MATTQDGTTTEGTQAHTEKDYEGLSKAVTEFQEGKRVPKVLADKGITSMDEVLKRLDTPAAAASTGDEIDVSQFVTGDGEEKGLDVKKLIAHVRQDTRNLLKQDRETEASSAARKAADLEAVKLVESLPEPIRPSKEDGITVTPKLLAWADKYADHKLAEAGKGPKMPKTEGPGSEQGRPSAETGTKGPLEIAAEKAARIAANQQRSSGS